MKNPENSHQSPSNANDSVTVPLQPSPPSDLPLTLTPASPAHSYTSLDLPGIQLRESLLASMKDSPEDGTPQQSFQNARTMGDSSIGGSFNSLRRVMKSGEEVIMGSDGDDTDSIGSLEDVESLIMESTVPKNDVAEKKELKNSSFIARTGPRFRYNSKTNIFGIPDISVPKYKNTLDLLVSQTVEDRKTEESVARTKAAYETEFPRTGGQAHEGQKASEVNEDMLRSAAGDMDDDYGLSRVVGAVQRTNGYDRPKLWSAFDNQAGIPDKPEFPRDAIVQESYLAILRG